MSEDQTTQAVVDETKVPAPQGTEATGARTDDGDLDALLSQWDKPSSKPSDTATPATAAPAADHVKDATAEVLAARDEIRTERFQRDMHATIKDVRGDLPSDLYDDDIVQSWIDAQARKDPRLANAWVNRNAEPKKFDQVKAALGKEFAKRYGRIPDQAATEDRAAVASAVRGSSQRAPEAKAPNYAEMSNSEFEAEKAKYA